MLSIILAMAENRVIGRGGDLPWHLPEDLKHFKRTTAGHTVIMGRRTWESLGPRERPLPGRRNIVVTRQTEYHTPGAEVVHSFRKALHLAHHDDEAFILGGGEIFREALPVADRIYLTLVHAEVAGDAFFPELDMTEWKLVDERRHPADDRNEYAMTFRVYERGK
jgi:dihydrofolate reductase